MNLHESPLIFGAKGLHNFPPTIDTEMKAKRDNIISELITLRLTKAKAKEKSGGGGGSSNEIHLKVAVMQKKLIGINKF